MRAPSRAIVSAGLAVLSPTAFCQTPDPISAETFITPPKEIADAVLAPWYRNTSIGNLSPDRSYALQQESTGMPGIDQMGRQHYILGGTQIDPLAYRARRFSIRSGAGLSMLSLADRKTRKIETPKDAGVTNASWSPDGKWIGYLAHFDNGTFLYVADTATGKSKRLLSAPLLATLVTDFEWTDDGKTIAAVLVPKGAKSPGNRPSAESPKVRVSDPKPKRLRTYAGLLETPHQMALLEHYSTGQLALIDVASGKVKEVGTPAMLTGLSASPDGIVIRVTTMEN
ncbi:MAG TPA: hypothetical protein VEX38_07045, partial [Fimbriimonadaceae bacterium]|nr:hypothetical protein [Fimbriimonadaceae bacterium]